MKNPFARLPLQWKIFLSFSAAITLLFVATGWIAIHSATVATTESVNHEVRASFEAYQSIWKARADRLSSISSILSAMSDVRAAFSTGDEATIRDTAHELWARVSDEDAIFLVTTPRGHVIASLGGPLAAPFAPDLSSVRDAMDRFPEQSSGFLLSGGHLYHITVTPVYVQASQGEALLNVLVAGYAISDSLAARLRTATGGSEFLFICEGRVAASTLSQPDSSAVARQLADSPAGVRTASAEYAPLITPLADIRGNRIGSLAILRSFTAANREISLLRRNLSLLWFFSLVAVLGVTYLVARHIVEPVKQLDRAAAAVAAQNYDYEVPVTSQDELGRLAATFNLMCASIRHAREELIRSERIGAVGRLATSVVHDLRNPLAAIYGGAEMLMESRLSPGQVQRLAANMYQASSRIRQMLDELLNLGRGKAIQRQRVALRELIEHVSEALALDGAEPPVHIVLDVPEDIRADLDRHRIERVIANLIDNAVDAMPHGGTITISANRDGEWVKVAVRDTGPGLAPEIRDRLFQPFVTGGKGTGTGLGLVLSRQAVIDHGGEMWAEPNAGTGACFVFRVPQAWPAGKSAGQTVHHASDSR